MVSGIRRMSILGALVGMGGVIGGPDVLTPAGSAPANPTRERHSEQERRRQEQRLHEDRARERKRRRRSEEEMRERLLRERISKGQDDRPDKYLHASARRRREAERAARSLIAE